MLYAGSSFFLGAAQAAAGNGNGNSFFFHFDLASCAFAWHNKAEICLTGTFPSCNEICMELESQST